MDIPLLKDMVIIFGLAMMVLMLCTRFGVPSIVGFLFTGVICGPFGLGLIEGIQNVDILAQIGIMLLLFTIGLEFSINRLKEIRKAFFVGGSLQIVLTILIGFATAIILSRPLGEAVFLGFLLSMSSTAIVLKSLNALEETDSPHGRFDIGILIFQDMAAVPMMLLIPMLSGHQHGIIDADLVFTVLLGIIVITLLFIAAVKFVPFLLYQIAKTRSRELFTLSVLTICFAVAWISSSIGLSLAMGAFLAGLIISNSDYRHEALGNILPIQDVFLSLFFVSIGMLLDIGFVLNHLLLIIILTGAVMLMKAIVVAITGYCLGHPLRAMILSGIALSQIGEFSFVLARTGSQMGLAPEFHYQLFLAVALLSMALTPTLIGYSQNIVNYLLSLPLPEKWKIGLIPDHKEEKTKHQQHIVIIGFGIAGRHLAYAAKDVNIPYVVAEMNPETVKLEKDKGQPIHFGDATHETILLHLNVPDAKAVAVMINDPYAARRAVQLARKLNPEVYIIVRARYIYETDVLRSLGANEVIPDEFGTSIEMFMHVLRHFQTPAPQIEKLVDMFRKLGSISPSPKNHREPEVQISSHL